MILEWLENRAVPQFFHSRTKSLKNRGSASFTSHPTVYLKDTHFITYDYKKIFAYLFWNNAKKRCSFLLLLLHEFLNNCIFKAKQLCITVTAAHREIAHCALDVHHLVYNELREKKRVLGWWWWGSCHTENQREDEWHDYNFCWTVSQFTGLDFSSFLFLKFKCVFQDDDLQ